MENTVYKVAKTVNGMRNRGGYKRLIKKAIIQKD